MSIKETGSGTRQTLKFGDYRNAISASVVDSKCVSRNIKQHIGAGMHTSTAGYILHLGIPSFLHASTT